MRQLYDLRIRSENGYPARICTNGDFHWTDHGINVELESICNYRGNVVHMDVHRAGEHAPLCHAPDWLQERDIPVTYVAYLAANPAAHAHDILVETRHVLRRTCEAHTKEHDQLRKAHQPTYAPSPTPALKDTSLR